MNAPRQHDSQSTGLEQQLHGMSLQQDISAGPDGDYFHEGAPQFQPRQQAPPQHQFGTEPLNNGAMNGNSVNGGFEYAQMVPGGDFNSAPSRTVYLGNVPQDITAKELLDHVRSGVVENMRILPEKMCAFISFLDESSALLFHSDAILKRLTIKDNDIKIGWGRNVPLTSLVLASVQRDGATRNVYIGSLPKTITEEQLRNDLSGYGIIDTVKILQDKGVAFVHFCSIASAIKVVTTLGEKNEFYADKKIFYGKDRCAFITKTQQHNAAQYLGLAPGMEHLVTNADREFISSTLLQQSAAAAAIATTAGGANNLGNRTVYLGNLPKDVKVEEICNVVRGGLLQNVKYLQDRHVCFITFIDPIAAAQFYAMAQIHGLTIHNKRIKIGWGKHSGPLSNGLTLAVSSGASRNIYIGNIDPHDPKFSKDALRKKFSEYGDIEQINFLLEKNCVFVNFTSISNAILAIDKIKIDEDFKDLKINFGKDRCGNIPRQFVNNNQGGNHGLQNIMNK
ncbi:CYFA0S23e01134g1_1 [Cyberlindnera fabianii]|uniref:CYFA0S23e01134g1_1 n=1 Tax=Cyberlindnera fabianii TaxID=36022 RepID=A0A061BHJ9_CYBFA|nr:CYFA0S23e01134g1_1 [Cyberlindnera fabianii]